MNSLVVLALVLCSVSATQACMCWPSHPQSLFCKAHFVVRAHIINCTSDGDLAPQICTIGIIKIFKGLDVISRSKRSTEYESEIIETSLYTPPRAISCWFPLIPGKVYLLSGKIRENGKLHMGFCDWRKEWHRLTDSQREGVKHNYLPNCQCQVGNCFGHSCSEKLRGCGKVEWQPRYKEVCKRMYTYCKAVSDTQCEWVQNAQYSRCWEDMP